MQCCVVFRNIKAHCSIESALCRASQECINIYAVVKASKCACVNLIPDSSVLLLNILKKEVKCVGKQREFFL